MSVVCFKISRQSLCFARSFRSLVASARNVSNDPKSASIHRCPRPAPRLLIHAQQIRCKTSRKKTKPSEGDEDSDDDSDDEIKDEPGSKVITGHMASLRADLVLKTGLGISRNKIETLFYESKIRVNGGKIKKKSQQVDIGDEVDVIKGASPVNEEMLIVSRVVVLNAKPHDDEDKLVVKMRRFKSLTIENTEPS